MLFCRISYIIVKFHLNAFSSFCVNISRKDVHNAFFLEILYASLEKCQRILGTPISMYGEETLKKLHYVKAIGLEKFCSFMYQLENIIFEKPNVIKQI